MSWKSFNKFMTGNDKSWTLKFKTLYSETFKRHNHIKNDEEASVVETHPKPWKWFRVFGFLLLISAFSFLNVLMVGELAFPWLALIFSAVIPITVAVFLFETLNAEKVKLLDIFLMFLIGTTVAFLAVGILNIDLGRNGLNAALVAPIIEEIAKVIPIIIAIHLLKVKRVSTALFIGWIIGSGFQIAETLGYATFFGYEGIFSKIEFIPGGYKFIGSLDFSTLVIRFFVGFGSHAFWGAIEGAAFIFAKKAGVKKYNFGRFAIWIGFCIVMHSLWNTNSTFNNHIFLSFLIMGLIQAMYIPIFFYLIDSGLRDEKEFAVAKEGQVSQMDKDLLENTF